MSAMLDRVLAANPFQRTADTQQSAVNGRTFTSYTGEMWRANGLKENLLFGVPKLVATIFTGMFDAGRAAFYFAGKNDGTVSPFWSNTDIQLVGAFTYTGTGEPSYECSNIEETREAPSLRLVIRGFIAANCLMKGAYREALKRSLLEHAEKMGKDVADTHQQCIETSAGKIQWNNSARVLQSKLLDFVKNNPEEAAGLMHQIEEKALASFVMDDGSSDGLISLLTNGCSCEKETVRLKGLRQVFKDVCKEAKAALIQYQRDKVLTAVQTEPASAYEVSRSLRGGFKDLGVNLTKRVLNDKDVQMVQDAVRLKLDQDPSSEAKIFECKEAVSNLEKLGLPKDSVDVDKILERARRDKLDGLPQQVNDLEWKLDRLGRVQALHEESEKAKKAVEEQEQKVKELEQELSSQNLEFYVALPRNQAGTQELEQAFAGFAQNFQEVMSKTSALNSLKDGLKTLQQAANYAAERLALEGMEADEFPGLQGRIDQLAKEIESNKAQLASLKELLEPTPVEVPSPLGASETSNSQGWSEYFLSFVR